MNAYKAINLSNTIIHVWDICFILKYIMSCLVKSR